MTAGDTNAARHTKRPRATREEMEARFDAIVAIVKEIQPATVRQVFYQASVRGIVDKNEGSYAKVQRALVALRRSGRIPWQSIADNTRWPLKQASFSSPKEAMLDAARHYRKALWDDAEVYVEVWIEKDALSSIAYAVTNPYDVPLMVARGYSSLTFLQDAAADIVADGRPAHIYHLGDYDPSGVDAAHKIEETLRSFAPGAEIHFTRLAVLPEQIEAWSLPTRPTKTSDTRSRNFGDVSVELDAIDPNVLRRLVSDAIEQHLPKHRYRALKAAEESERRLIMAWAEQVSL